VGILRLGPNSDPIKLDFVLEAKLRTPTSGVGVREAARLISRIRNRMFGVLVTTSFLDRQAYEELRADGHPVVVIGGRDLVEILKRHGYATDQAISALLEQFPGA
jgi:hypothetical protein